MKRIAIIGTITAAVALLGTVKPSSAETTVPLEDLSLVSETSVAAEPTRVDDKAKTDIAPRFQYPRFQFPRFQSPRFQFTRFQFPRFQSPRFQFPRFQNPHFQLPRFQNPRFQYPRSHGI